MRNKLICSNKRADPRYKRPSNNFNFFVTQDYYLPLPDSALNWRPDLDRDIDTADLNSTLTISLHDIDLAIDFIVVSL